MFRKCDWCGIFRSAATSCNTNSQQNLRILNDTSRMLLFSFLEGRDDRSKLEVTQKDLCQKEVDPWHTADGLAPSLWIFFVQQRVTRCRSFVVQAIIPRFSQTLYPREGNENALCRKESEEPRQLGCFEKQLFCLHEKPQRFIQREDC